MISINDFNVDEMSDIEFLQFSMGLPAEEFFEWNYTQQLKYHERIFSFAKYDDNLRCVNILHYDNVIDEYNDFSLQDQFFKYDKDYYIENSDNDVENGSIKLNIQQTEFNDISMKYLLEEYLKKRIIHKFKSKFEKNDCTFILSTKIPNPRRSEKEYKLMITFTHMGISVSEFISYDTDIDGLLENLYNSTM